MKESVHRDRLSELPQSVIHLILSFLPLRDVVSTTVLSKSWENLWTTVPCLNLISSYEDEDDWTEAEYEDEDAYNNRLRKRTERSQKFVNWALMLWKGSKILKFTIDLEYHGDISLVTDVDLWVRFALNNKVEEFELLTTAGYWAPQCLNSCSSLRKLSLVGCSVQRLGSPSWNQLKSLKINSRLNEDLLNRILLGSPELEVLQLILIENCESLNIRSRSLKMLLISNYEDEPSQDTLRIFCPNLETLAIYGLFGKCLFTGRLSLTHATFDFCNDSDYYHCEPASLRATFDFCNDSDYYHCEPASLRASVEETLKEVFSAIEHVETVALSSLCVEVFGASHKKYILPPLPNVKFLKLFVRRIEFGNMMDLLGIFPNLEMLVIKHPDCRKLPDFNTVNYMKFEANLSKSFLLQLKIVDFTAHSFDLSIVGFIEFLLKHAIMLERLVLWSEGINQQMFSEKLSSVPRSSPTVKVILKNIS